MKRHISRTTGALLLSSTLLCSVSLADALSAGAAWAAPEVLSGCEVPVAPVHSFYVDPVNGDNTTGDGSSAKPWKDLWTVLNKKTSVPMDVRGVRTLTNPTAPVKGGDIIYLRNGNYGDLSLAPMFHDKFLTLAAEPGHKPVFTSIYGAGNKFIFKGLTIQGRTVAGTRITQGFSWANGSNVILTESTMRSGPDADKWSVEKFKAEVVPGPSLRQVTCGTITNNTIRFIGRGLGLDGAKILAKNNMIDYFAGDAIDVMAQDSVISHNVIKNHYPKMEDGNHNDAIQGWHQNGATSVANLVVDSNTIIESTGEYSEIPSPAGQSKYTSDYMQGIFGGQFKNIRITNNIVNVTGYNGIAVVTDGGLFANNTLVAAHPRGSWMGARSSPNVVIRNNIVPSMNNYLSTPVLDHNLVGADPKKIFVAYDPANKKYDFNLLPGTAAVGTGSNLLTPAIDMLGKKVNTPADLGALAFAGAVKAPITPTPTPTPTPAPVVDTTYKGTITLKGNARQFNNPKLNVKVDGRDIGTVAIVADGGLGQVGDYKIDFVSPTKPSKVTLTVQGLSPDYNQYRGIGLFNVNYGPTGATVKPTDLIRVVDGSKVVTGKANLWPTMDVLYTTGTTVEFNVAGR